MNSSTMHIKRRIGYCGLCLVLLVGLFVQTCTPERDHPVWDAELVIWVNKQRSRVRNRAAIARRVHTVERRGLVMLCRMGLMMDAEPIAVVPVCNCEASSIDFEKV